MKNRLPARNGRSTAYALNQPLRIAVRTDADAMPLQIFKGKTTSRVTAVIDRWLAEDRWWRNGEQRRRLYMQLLIANGNVATIFCDLTDNTWWSQHSGVPLHRFPAESHGG